MLIESSSKLGTAHNFEVSSTRRNLSSLLLNEAENFTLFSQSI